MKKFLYRPADLKEFMVEFLKKLNVPVGDAEIAANILLEADLRGVDSHGIIRLNSYYGNRLRAGMIDPSTSFQVLQETPSSLSIDCANGLGQVVSFKTMQRCIEKAKTANICMATVRNSNHYGIAGYYAMMALPDDMIGISFTNSQPLVAPTHGRTAVLGSNPIAVAVPCGTQQPFVLDMATSIVPIGRIAVFEKSGKLIPEGWGIDRQGVVTNDPTAVSHGGALLPLGGIDEMRGYKGYGLALLVDIFCGVLAGASFGSNVGLPQDLSRTTDIGHFFAAIRIDAFRPLDDFKRDMDHLLTMIKESPKALGEDRIYIHGEKEFDTAARNAKAGIPLSANVIDSLIKDAFEIGIEFIAEPVGEIET